MLAYQLQGTQFDNDKEKVALILNGSKKISEYQEELANSLKTYLSQYINFPETKELLKKISKDMHLLCEFNRGIKILENYNKLTEHNIQRILKHPNEFFKSYQILKRHDLESKAYNLQSIVDDPKKFMNCYHILEKLGLISKEFLIYMLYHPNFPKVYGTLGKSGFNQTGHIRVILEFQINKKSTTIDTDKFIEIFKILKEYGLDKEKKYFKIACESQGEFENNFNHLKNIGLANRKYVQAVLEHQDLYRMFKSMLGGSVEPKYVSAILDGPLQSEKNLKNFLTLFSPVAPQPEYIKKMLDHPGGFGIVFNALKNSKYRLITFPKESIENALNNIEQFARICSNLNEHLYSGYINHRKILENLDQFERNYERLKKSGLENWSQYILIMLEYRADFDAACDCLESLKLCNADNLILALTNPSDFMKSYEILLGLKLHTDTTCVQLVLNDPGRFLSICKTLQRADLHTNSNCVRLALTNVKKFFDIAQKLQTILLYADTKRFKVVLGNQDKFFSVYPTLKGIAVVAQGALNSNAYTKSVIKVVFDHLMQENFAQNELKTKLVACRKSFPDDSALGKINPDFAKLEQKIMSCLQKQANKPGNSASPSGMFHCDLNGSSANPRTSKSYNCADEL